MADIIQVSTTSENTLKKLRDSLEAVADRINNERSTEVTTALSEAMSAFQKFFTEVGDPQFTPEMFLSGDTARSDTYNSNLRGIFNDIKRFYSEIRALANAQLQAYNYSQIVSSEIISRADGLASTVLDLNILNNFTKGDVIVAGDDFKNSDYIDSDAGTASTQAEPLSGGSGLALARDSSNDLTGPGTVVEIIPLGPTTKIGSSSSLSSVNTEPTPENLGRFYEGSYYGFLGEARPEGGRFNFKYILDPTGVDDEETRKNLNDKSVQSKSGFFLDLGASEDAKKLIRLNMFDKDPSTFWECEYVVKLPTPLIDDLVGESSVEEKDDNPQDDPESPRGASLGVHINQLDSKAQEYDRVDNIDLVIDVIVTLPQADNVNFVSINPVVFGVDAFIDILDISTSSDDEGEFVTVDGWDRIKFARTLTPEANEFLTDTQVGASLAPSKYAYKGQGIYPFPVRVAKKVKVRLRMEQPVADTYEKTYVLLNKTVETETTVSTTTKKGWLSF